MFDDDNLLSLLVGFVFVMGACLGAIYLIQDFAQWDKYQKVHHCVESTKWTEKGRFVCDGGEVVTR